MPVTIPNLWPEEIAVDVITPLALLKTQAGNLTSMTKGVLVADVQTTTADGTISLRLQLVAPALNGFRRTVLTATHNYEQPYPVRIEAAVFEPVPDPEYGPDPDEPDWRPVAWTLQELIDLVKKSLQSREIKSLIQSLIARSNEATTATAEQDQK